MNNHKTTSGPSNGALIAHGGGNLDNDSIFKEIFLKLAGGPNSNLIYIPSAFSDEQLNGQQKNHLDPNFAANRFGFNKATILHTRSPKEADSESFVRPFMEAKAVFITGGRQWRLADSYLGTKTYQELINLLHRGGVIAGSSAGATIQGSFLVRGNSKPDDNRIMIGDHQKGFSLIANAAIDQHLLEMNRQFDMIEVLKIHPDLLGISIDANTSIVVKGHEMTVFGSSYVAIYDGPLISKERENFYDLHAEIKGFYLLRHGNRYDIKARKIIQ